MTECMDEFDEATPLRGTYCSRLTSEEYEEQGARCTEFSSLSHDTHTLTCQHTHAAALSRLWANS